MIANDHDFETFSEVDLFKAGAAAYSEHPSTEVLMLAWQMAGEKDVSQWIPHEREMPAELKEMIRDPHIQWIAWNKTFEYNIFKNTLGIHIPHERWSDPMVLAHSLSLPGSLEKVGTILGLSQDKAKMTEGKKLIQRFCKPQPKNHKVRRWDWLNDPEQWETFCEYNRQDVTAQRIIRRTLRKWDMPEHEWALWHLDQKINDRGLPVDTQLVNNALRMSDANRQDLLKKARTLTGIDNPNSDIQLTPWLGEQGVVLPNFRKATVAKALQGDLPAPARNILELRSQWKKTSTRKFDALLRTLSNDGYLRNTLQFAGAGRTWRWAGRVVQIQNLPRGTLPNDAELDLAVELVREGDNEFLNFLYDNPMDVLSSLIRAAFRAPEGHHLTVADLNAIENRVLGWFCRCQRILRVFEKGLCPYKSFGMHLFKVPYAKVTKQQRTDSKPAVLGAGYMLGGGKEKEAKDGELAKTGLWGYAESMSIKLSKELSHSSVKMWRDLHPEVVEMWWKLDKAARECITHRRTVRCGAVTFDYSKPFMRIRLPSGRYLHYLRPRIEPRKTPWGEMRLTVTYEGLDQNTRQWVRLSTHPGKWMENIIQAIARDVLAAGLIEADRIGFDIIGHVHDEIIALTPDDSPLTVADLENAMCVPLPWAPDMPLKAEGWQGPYYKKD